MAGSRFVRASAASHYCPDALIQDQTSSHKIKIQQSCQNEGLFVLPLRPPLEEDKEDDASSAIVCIRTSACSHRPQNLGYLPRVLTTGERGGGGEEEEEEKEGWRGKESERGSKSGKRETERFFSLVLNLKSQSCVRHTVPGCVPTDFGYAADDVAVLLATGQADQCSQYDFI
ncbi:hypothetical protein QQF64_035526 [Cirrhinus molitorella]|uniref:Uncharacterized protein n=1 Tax=Cirrhinus molitorella TaxID=172907 RepID=A0ABR3NGS9_9TELE